MDKAWKRHSSVRELMRMGVEAEERRCWKFQCFVGAEKPFLTLASHSSSSRQEGLLEMIPA